jgi:hypothetical protein
MDRVQAFIDENPRNFSPEQIEGLRHALEVAKFGNGIPDVDDITTIRDIIESAGVPLAELERRDWTAGEAAAPTKSKRFIDLPWNNCNTDADCSLWRVCDGGDCSWFEGSAKKKKKKGGIDLPWNDCTTDSDCVLFRTCDDGDCEWI